MSMGMKVYIVLFWAIVAMSISIAVRADTCTVDGVVVNNCVELGDSPNTLVQWKKPTEREDNKSLDPNEIADYTVYSKNVDTGNFWNELTINSGTAEAFYREYPEGTWEIFMTTIDSDGRVSSGSLSVIKECCVTTMPPPVIAPPMPPILIDVPAGNNVELTFVPKP